MRPLIGLDLDAGGRGELAAANERTSPADERALPASRMTSIRLELMDAPRIAADLLASAKTAGDSRATRVLVEERDLTISIVALLRGARIAEQSARSTVVIPIFGRVRFATGNGIVDLMPGRSLFSGRDQPHEIIADEDAALMLVCAA
jgi:quercetin dioxygenase-like cupin family protein